MLLKIFFIIPFLLFSKSSHSFFFSDNKCEKLEWAVEDSRTQGGGWIWFPGKGTGTTVEESYGYAENLALQRLVQECQGIPIDAKFHERCDQKNGDTVESFVRVSVRDSECKLAQRKESKINKQLQDQLEDYLQLKNLKEISGLGDKEKLNYANSIVSENNLLAIKIYKSLCDKSNQASCYFYYNQLFKNGEYEQAFEGTSQRCLSSDVSFCVIAVKSKMQKNNFNSFIDKVKKDKLLQKIVTKAKDKHLPGYFYAQLENDLKKREVIHSALCESGSAISCAEGAMIALLERLPNLSTYSKKLNELAREDSSGATNFWKARVYDMIGQTDSANANDEKACDGMFYSCVIQFLRTNEQRFYEKLKNHIEVIKFDGSPYSEIAHDILQAKGQFETIFKTLGKNKKRYEEYCNLGIWDTCQLLIIRSNANDEKLQSSNADLLCSVLPESYGCFVSKVHLAKEVSKTSKDIKDFCIAGRPYQDEACDLKVFMVLLSEIMSDQKNASAWKRKEESFRRYCKENYVSSCSVLFPEYIDKFNEYYWKECSKNSIYSYYYCETLAFFTDDRFYKLTLHKLESIKPKSKIENDIFESKKNLDTLKKALAAKKK